MASSYPPFFPFLPTHFLLRPRFYRLYILFSYLIADDVIVFDVYE